jgi:hypothetical protein
MSGGETEKKESATITDKNESIKSKQCNKFSIEHILGLNDEKLTKVNRAELMRFEKGEPGTKCEPLRLIRNDES